MLNLADNQNYSICNDLLSQLERFFEMLDRFQKSPVVKWLTVEEVAQELKVSRSIVYRIIRNGDLEAVNIVDTQGKIAHKGHYRIKRRSLEQYLEQKKVKPMNQPSSRPRRQIPLLKVKNHLGL